MCAAINEPIPRDLPPNNPHCEHKQQHQRNAGYNFRVYHRKICNIHHNAPGQLFRGIDAYGRHGAQYGRGYRCRYSYNQGVAQRLKNQSVLEQLLIPFKGEAAPHSAAGRLRIIEKKIR